MAAIEMSHPDYLGKANVPADQVETWKAAGWREVVVKKEAKK